MSRICEGSDGWCSYATMDCLFWRTNRILCGYSREGSLSNKASITAGEEKVIPSNGTVGNMKK
jgi:hypothetical protein